MFDFDEFDNNRIKQLEKQNEELENQVKHWKSMYEREVKKRPIIVKYENDMESNKRIRKILKLHHDTKDNQYKEMLIQSLYLDYGIETEPSNALYEWWVRQNE